MAGRPQVEIDQATLTIGELEDMAEALDISMAELGKMLERRPTSLAIWWAKRQGGDLTYTLEDARKMGAVESMEFLSEAMKTGIFGGGDTDPNAGAGDASRLNTSGGTSPRSVTTTVIRRGSSGGSRRAN